MYFFRNIFVLSAVFYSSIAPIYARDSDLVDQNSCSYILIHRLTNLLSENKSFLLLRSFKEGKFVYETGNMERAKLASSAIAKGTINTLAPYEVDNYQKVFKTTKAQAKEIPIVFCIVTLVMVCTAWLGIGLAIASIPLATMPLWAIFDGITNGFGYAYNLMKNREQEKFNLLLKKFRGNEEMAKKEYEKFFKGIAEAFAKDNDASEIMNIVKMYSIINDAKQTSFRMDGKDFNEAVDKNLILPSKWTSPFNRRTAILKVKEVIRELDSQGELCESLKSPNPQLAPSYYFDQVKRILEGLPLALRERENIR